MGIAVRNEGSKINSNINVTPMVDVMLVLLIIFMVITPMLMNKVQIDMVTVNNAIAMPDADKTDAIVVAVTRDGAVFLGQDRIDPESDSAARCATGWRTEPTRQSMSAQILVRSSAGGRRHRRCPHRRCGNRLNLLTQRREGNLAARRRVTRVGIASITI